MTDICRKKRGGWPPEGGIGNKILSKRMLLEKNNTIYSIVHIASHLLSLITVIVNDITNFCFRLLQDRQQYF